MPIARVQVRIPSLTAIPEDTAINTWHFTCTAIDEGTRADIAAALVAFYEALDGHKSPLMSWQTTRVRWYNLDDPEPRTPVAEAGLALTSAPPGSPLPREVAYCLSFAATAVSGSSPARRRGRIYFGPLATGVDTATGRPTTLLRTAAAGAGGTLLTTSNAASDWAWVIWSPTANQAYPVVRGWADDEFDTQRRRGTRPTARSTF